MHRATASNTSFRAYSAGGARATIDSIDPSKLMQEIGASMMKGEKRGKIEAPSMYGFASNPHEADKGEDGKPGLGPETFISFMGGNRSFPVAGPIDDRRHRLLDLIPGDVALFGGKETGQQFHLNGVGAFLSAFAGAGKKLRLQLVAKEGEDASKPPGYAQPKAGAGGGSQAGQTGSQGQQKPTGQKPVYKNASSQFIEVTDEGTESVNHAHATRLPDGTAVILREGKCYLGGDPAKGHRFAQVATVAGPSINVFARIG